MYGSSIMNTWIIIIKIPQENLQEQTKGMNKIE